MPRPAAESSQTSNHDILLQQIKSAQNLLDVFARQDTIALRALPNQLWNRMIYAMVTLVRISLLLYSHGRSDYENVTSADKYLDMTLGKVVDAAGSVEFRVPCAFAGPLNRLYKWYTYQLRVGLLMPETGPLMTLFAGANTHACLQEPDEASLSPGSNQDMLQSYSSSDPPFNQFDWLYGLDDIAPSYNGNYNMLSDPMEGLNAWPADDATLLASDQSTFQLLDPTMLSSSTNGTVDSNGTMWNNGPFP